MQALYFQKNGTPSDVIEFGNIERPRPSENEVLVKTLAAPINPADFLFIEGRYRVKSVFPQTAGLEGAGLVEETGPGVPLEKGALVSFRHKGSWAQYVLVPTDKLFKLPSAFPVEKAAQFSLNPLTAWALLHEARPAPGDWLLVTAGQSAVSKIITQLAKKRGVHVIATVRSQEQGPELLRLGATQVIVTDGAPFAQDVLAMTGGRGVAAALDAVGGKTGTEIINCIGVNGRIILYGLLSPDSVQFHNADVIMKLASIQGFGLDYWLSRANMSVKETMLAELVEALQQPGFEMPVAGQFSLQQYREAIESSKEKAWKGKSLFCFD